MKKALSIFLSVALLISIIIPMSVGAATPNTKPGTALEIGLELTKEDGTPVKYISELELGETVKLYAKTLNFTDPKVVDLYLLQVVVSFPKTAFSHEYTGYPLKTIPAENTFGTYYDIDTNNTRFGRLGETAGFNLMASVSHKLTTGRFVSGIRNYTIAAWTLKVEDLSESSLDFDVVVSSGINGSFARASTGAVQVDTTITQPTGTKLTIPASAPVVDLVKSVKFTNKDATDYYYDVTLNPEAGKQYKVYVKDAVYGWTLARAYAPYTEPFNIKVTNPSNPFEIEVLASEDGVPDAEPTFSATLAELGQLDATVAFAGGKTAYSVGEAITVNADVILPTDINSANYEIYFADSRKSFTGTASGSVSESFAAKRAGTYTATVRFVDPANATNTVVKTLSYTVVENVATNLPYFDGDTAFKVNGNKLRPNTNLNITNPSIDMNGSTANTFYSYRFVSPVGDSKYETTNIPKPGVYHAYADIISGGVVVDTAYTSITIGRDTDSVSISKVDVENNGGTYTFTITAENAQEYMFIRRDEIGYRTVKTWSVGDNEWTWTPARNGTYEILAYAKRSDAGSYEAVKTLTVDVGTFEKKAVPTYAIDQTIAGKATTLTATAPAGTKIAYEIYDPFSNTSIYSGYGNGTFTFVPAKARTYKITTFVKADTNSGAYDNKTTTTETFTTAD